MSEQIAIFGATSGIAEQTARRYAERGAELFLFARNREKAEAVANDCRVRGASSAEVIEADLAKPGGHAKLIQNLRASAPNLRKVLVAYGTLPDQEKVQDDYGEIRAAFKVNALSVISLLTELLNTHSSSEPLTVGVITSVAGDRGRKSNYVYGAAKGALSLYLQGLRNRHFGSSVKIVDIRPGFVDTPMTAHLEKGPLFASAEKVAAGIVKALDRGGDIVYLPWFWRWIMLIIRSIPETIFKRLSI